MRNSWKDILTEEFLEREHYLNKKHLINIAWELGCDRKTINYYLKKYGMSVKRHPISYDKLQSHPHWKGYGDISASYWKNLLQGAKNRCKKFNVTIEEAWELYLKQNKKCALSGLEIGFESPKSNSASLDRIDSNKEYNIDNLQWVHKDVNTMKWNLEQNHFINLCKKIANHQNGNTNINS